MSAALVGTALACLGSACDRPAERSVTEPARGAGLVVVSYNIEGGEGLDDDDHLAGVVRTLSRLDPDVVALQEVYTTRRVDQAAEVARALGLHADFGASLAVGDDAYGNAVLSADPTAECTLRPLSAVSEPRSALACRLATEVGRVRVVTTHLATGGPFRSWERTEQVRELADLLRSDAELPLLAPADLNVPPGFDELIPLWRMPDLRLSGRRRATTHRIFPFRIDYILVGSDWRIVDTSVERSGPSDHYPVVARVSRRDSESVDSPSS